MKGLTYALGRDMVGTVKNIDYFIGNVDNNLNVRYHGPLGTELKK